MNTHPTDWLDAFYDGELDPQRHQQVQLHVDNCPICREQIASRAALSDMLQSVPGHNWVPDNKTILEQVMQEIQPGQSSVFARRNRLSAWWLTPALLVAGWAFLQALFFIAGLFLQISPVQLSTLEPSYTPSILENFFSMAFLPRIYTWLLPAIDLLPGSNALQLFFLEFILSCICTILLSSWLAGWFAYHRHVQFSAVDVNFQA